MTHAEDLGDVTMSDTMENFGNVLGGVLSVPWLKGGMACILAGCEALGLPIDLVWCLVGLFIADFVLGIWLAARMHQFSLAKFARGFAKIPVYTLLLIVGWLCQYVVQAVLGQDVPAPLWVCAYLSMHEALSLLTKCEALDLPVPSLLRNALHRINHAAEQKVEEALDIIDKPKRKRTASTDDGAFKKF